jgi:hypothetical protein
VSRISFISQFDEARALRPLHEGKTRYLRTAAESLCKEIFNIFENNFTVLMIVLHKNN